MSVQEERKGSIPEVSIFLSELLYYVSCSVSSFFSFLISICLSARGGENVISDQLVKTIFNHSGRVHYTLTAGEMRLIGVSLISIALSPLSPYGAGFRVCFLTQQRPVPRPL